MLFMKPICGIQPAAVTIACLFTIPAASGFSQSTFGRVTVTPQFELDGAGLDVDSITFWETSDPGETLMFVSAKKNQLVEVWKYPFLDNEQEPLRHTSFTAGARVNGLAMDQASDLLFVAISRPASTVSVFRYPGGKFVRAFIKGSLNLRTEPNIELFKAGLGHTRVYVTADDMIYVYDSATGLELNRFRSPASVETILADEYYERLYVPDEKNRSGVFVLKPDGRPFVRHGRSRFGHDGVFQADAEGILLLAFPGDNGGDSGAGLIVISDQRKDQTDFEFFDRESWKHLGTLNIEGVSNTDGIASTQRPLPDYPLGLFVAINDDQSTVGVSWETILKATVWGDAPPKAQNH